MTEPCAIGLDIGGTGIRAARVTVSGRILAETSEATAKSASLVIDQIDRLIANLDHPSATAIGIGVPSRVDHHTGQVFTGGFVDLSGPPLAGRIRGARGLPVFVDNDGNMALMAEARAGAGRGLAHLVMLTIGTGIGGSAMLNGAIVHGHATAGELGHITVSLDGPLCVCGRQGCLETLSSGTAWGRLIAEAGLPAGTQAEALLARNDALAGEVIARWTRPLRAGIDSLVAVYDPEMVVLGGGLGSAAGAALQRFPAVSSWFQCPVVAGSLGSRAGVVGAALAALERTL